MRSKNQTGSDNKLIRSKWFRVLYHVCPDHLYEEIEGDLIQRFNRDLRFYGENRAKRRLIWNIVRFIRPGIIFRHKYQVSQTSIHMLLNHFKIASRVMMRNKSYTIINLFGLTLGITSAMLLFTWIDKEFSYDQFHADKERIFTAWNRELRNGEIQCWNRTPRILAPTLIEEYPEVESAVSFASYGSSQLFTVGEKRLIKNSGAYTDPQFLIMFSFPLLKGNASNALDNPNAIVLTKSFARQLFGAKESLGETVLVGESGYTFPLQVTGILEDLPSNSAFHFDYLISFLFLESLGEKDAFWGNNSLSTFVKLKKGVELNHFNQTVKDIAKKHVGNEEAREIFLYPLTKMRLYSKFENGVASGGRIEIIRMLGLLGICLVAVASINFVNLSTARAQKRAKEVGIRKVTGAHRRSLIVQFLCESLLIAFGAGMLSIGIVYLALPWFSTLINQPLSLNIGDLNFWLISFALIGITGILAGSYPAFYLSSFRPVVILKGGIIPGSGRSFLRHVLVVFQFGFATILIISVLVIKAQINYTQSREAGYQKDHLVYHPITGDLQKNYQAYKSELLSRDIATAVTKTSSPITERWSSTDNIQWEGKDPQDKTPIERFDVDEDITRTAGLTVVEGRDIDLLHYPTDSTAVLLNESAVKLMGFKQSIGQTIVDAGIEWRVVGVVKDFVLTAPYQQIEPVVLFGAKKKMFDIIHIRLNPNRSTKENIAGMSALFSKFNPSSPFEYYFVDVEYQRKFAMLETTLTITTLFGSLSIFISCLGLLGLSTFIIESRQKEIGIRKIIGGSVASIVKLLTVSSLKPILVGIILFMPCAWWAMSWWLQSFHYRIALTGGFFMLAGAIVLLVSWMTIALQTFTAASINPVKSLRTE